MGYKIVIYLCKVKFLHLSKEDKVQENQVWEIVCWDGDLDIITSRNLVHSMWDMELKPKHWRAHILVVPG